MAYRYSLQVRHIEPVPLPLVGSSRVMHDLARQVDLIVRNDSEPAMILGEPGTGKGCLAAYIHAESARASFPFVEAKCRAQPNTTIGTDLSSVVGTPGDVDALLTAAEGGTIFVDEVNALPPQSQDLLHQILNQRAARATPRFMVAANKDLVGEVTAARFREDLYYQLSAAPIHIPPLRARSREDLVELIAATFNSLAMAITDAPQEIGDGVVDSLIRYPWPGNIRELWNGLERAITTARGATMLHRFHLPEWLGDAESDGNHAPRTMSDIERAHIYSTLHANKSNRTHAARELGISRATLIKKIKEYGLVSPAMDDA